MEYKKKLTDIFLRKEEKPKKQPEQKQSAKGEFDESYFDLQLSYDQYNTNLIKATAAVREGPNRGEQIPLNCRWYVKTEFDFKEIAEVKASCFQPCLEDVDSVICVQVEPHLDSLTYTGITIMKETDRLKLDRNLESQCNEYFSCGQSLNLEAKIEVVFSQDPRYEDYEYPLEVTIQLRGSEVSLVDRFQHSLGKYQVGEDFPQIDFIRKSFSSVLFNCNENQSMRLSLSNNFNRDLFALIIRSIPTRLSDFNIKQREETTVQSGENLELVVQSSHPSKTEIIEDHTKYVLKIDELNKEIKSLKRKNEQMTSNYHCERKLKINLENQLQAARTQSQRSLHQLQECRSLRQKIKTLSEENKFYFGEISLMKKQLKDKNLEIKTLKQQLQRVTLQMSSFESKVEELIEKPKAELETFKADTQEVKRQKEKLESENEELKERLVEVQNSNNILRKKLSSVVSEKSLPNSPVKSLEEIGSMESVGSSGQKDTQIKDLKMQVQSLEMLLKHKSGEKGGEALKLHQLVNSLSQRICQKELEIVTLKNINRELLKRK